MTRILYPIEEAAQQLGVGLTTARALIRTGELRSIRIGRARRIPADALHDYVRRLDEEQNSNGAEVAASTPSIEAPAAIQS